MREQHSYGVPLYSRLFLSLFLIVAKNPSFFSVSTARITQLILRNLDLGIQHPYQGNRKYRNSIGPEFSRLSTDLDSKAFIPKEESSGSRLP